MKLLARLALQHFQSLSVEKQRDILLEYVRYVEECNHQVQPDFFLEWYMQQPETKED